MTNIEPTEQPEPMDLETAQRVEREKMTRRAALRKLGFGAGMAAFSLLGVDDFARMVGSRMAQIAGDNKVANQVAKEFQQSGIAFAGGTSFLSCGYSCGNCGSTYANECQHHPSQNGGSALTCCQAACTSCCAGTQKNPTPCGSRPDAVIYQCHQACASYFGQPG